MTATERQELTEAAWAILNNEDSTEAERLRAVIDLLRCQL